GAEHLRVVRLEQNVAIEIIGNRLGFSPSRVAPGDLIWVYSLRLTHGFAMQALQKGIDLRNFTTLSYLEGVKSGNHPRTAFQVETFAHVTPHAAITCRLARVISTHKIVTGLACPPDHITEGDRGRRNDDRKGRP
ncbi:hypothetical protein PMAYCL1PPCAC_01395, partial [Pristionchus mayeri]